MRRSSPGSTEALPATDQDLTGFKPFSFRQGWTINKRWEWIKLAATGRLRQFSPIN